MFRQEGQLVVFQPIDLLPYVQEGRPAGVRGEQGADIFRIPDLAGRQDCLIKSRALVHERLQLEDLRVLGRRFAFPISHSARYSETVSRVASM